MSSFVTLLTLSASNIYALPKKYGGTTIYRAVLYNDSKNIFGDYFKNNDQTIKQQSTPMLIVQSQSRLGNACFIVVTYILFLLYVNY